MSSNITNLEEWKKRYSFLDTVWDTYDEFDKPLEGDYHMYEAVCSPFIKSYGEDMEENKRFCMKLVRNLGFYAPDTEFFDPNEDRCKILYYWVYNSVKNKNISNKLITDCFDDYKDHMTNIEKKPKCYYYPYENSYNEPMDMIILEIFHTNMKALTDILAKENNKINLDLQKYICECVNIYKEMDKKYCLGKDSNSSLTCIMLYVFKQMYNLYLSGKDYHKYKIPSLYDVEKEYTAKCLPSNLDVPSIAPRVNEVSELASLSEDTNDQGDKFAAPRPFTEDNPGGSMSRTVSTAVGTMAGASSILALLYKFTPGRNWIRSGIRGSRGRISNNLYAEQPNELFYDGYEGEAMSTYNPTYNVGYGST